jgi:hypothetical protein
VSDDDRYPTEVLDSDDDDGTMPNNVADLEHAVIGRGWHSPDRGDR